ncbi:MAG: glycosyltransferase family 2 protein [Armatimonadia bacterium]
MLPSDHVTIVVPTYNACHDLREAVLSLLAQDYPSLDVLVVDNNCTDGTCEMLDDLARRDARVRRVLETEQSVTCARNRGCHEAQGNYVAFLDHDEIAPPHWLSTLMQCHRETGAPGVGGPYQPLWEGTPSRWLARSTCMQETLSFMDFGRVRRPVDWLLGGNVLYTREALERVNYFGNWKSYTSGRCLVGGDDIVMGERMRRAGLQMHFEPAAVVSHKVPRRRQRLSYILRRAFWSGYTDLAIGREWKFGAKGVRALKRGPDAIAVGMMILPGTLYARLLVRLGYLHPLSPTDDDSAPCLYSVVDAEATAGQPQPAQEPSSDTELRRPRAIN